MASTSEYVLEAAWCIKNETFMNMKEDDEIASGKFKTAFPDLEYSFHLMKYESYYAIWIDTDASIKEMKLFIPSANFEGDLSVEAVVDPESEDNEEWVRTVFLKREDILKPQNKYFVDDILKIEIRGVLCYEEKISMDLGNLLWKSDDKDFTILVGTKKLKIHKCVLQSFSSVLATSSDTNELKIDNFEANVVATVIELCYGQKKWPCGTVANFFKIFEFTNLYDMPLIKEQVELKLKEKLNESNVCEFANKSVEYKATKLRGYCINFISNCIKNRTHLNEYGNLIAEIALEVFKNSVCPSCIS